MKIAGIDPGTGLTSPAALFIYDTQTKTIEVMVTFSSTSKDPIKRIRYIANKIGAYLSFHKPELISIENFFMRGKGGETLQRMIGSVIPFTPDAVPFIQVQNTTVKRIIGGSGKADKNQVGLGVLERLKEHNKADIEKQIDQQAWDILDAAAIALSGFEIWQKEKQKKK